MGGPWYCDCGYPSNRYFSGDIKDVEFDFESKKVLVKLKIECEGCLGGLYEVVLREKDFSKFDDEFFEQELRYLIINKVTRRNRSNRS